MYVFEVSAIPLEYGLTYQRIDNLLPPIRFFHLFPHTSVSLHRIHTELTYPSVLFGPSETDLGTSDVYPLMARPSCLDDRLGEMDRERY